MPPSRFPFGSIGMTHIEPTELKSLLENPPSPLTALAPMQDVTTLEFMQVITQCGPPDLFFTEYFRVHQHSRPEPHILKSITHNPSQSPVFAQLIGEDLEHMARATRELQHYPIGGIDLNMGCPAPKVYKKNVGGGLLRDVAKVDALLGMLRSICPGLFTVKMRIGFDSTENFDALLELINHHKIDLLSLHARTVKEMYRSEVHYEFIQQAVATVSCPVLANGNITSLKKAIWALDYTGAKGVMVGRSAIRNPWIFRQIREHFCGQTVFTPTLGDVRQYIDQLKEASYVTGLPERNHIARMKKFINFIGQGVDHEGAFLHKIRRTQDYHAFFTTCDTYLLGEHTAKPFASEPHANVVARPNREK